MTGNEPGTPGDNESSASEQGGPSEQDGQSGQDGPSEQGVGDSGETGQGGMAEAQDASAKKSRGERARAADAGDERARAEQTDAEQVNPAQPDENQPDENQSHSAQSDSAPDSERTVGDGGRPDRLRNATEWIDGKLAPRLGGADAGPWDDESEESLRTHDRCPLCGHPMSEHTIDRSSANAVLNCPAPQQPAPEHFEPLNEVGMIKRPAQAE